MSCLIQRGSSILILIIKLQGVVAKVVHASCTSHEPLVESTCLSQALTTRMFAVVLEILGSFSWVDST